MLTASPAVRLYGGVPTRRASLAANWRRRNYYSAASAGAAGSSAGDEKGSPSPPPSAASAAVGPGTAQEIEELKQELQEAEEELQVCGSGGWNVECEQHVMAWLAYYNGRKTQ